MSFIKTLSDNNKRIVFVAIIIATILSYSGSLKNDFVKGWDDGTYLFENNYLYDLNAHNLKIIFSTEEQGNYHPLTMLSYAIEYKFAKLDSPVIYHIDNTILHLLITSLVFYLIFLLTNNYFISFGVMLLFGIHPVHVESVAWISERKDLLYTFFFLISLIFYIKYTSSETQKKYLYYSLGFFVIACLSKGMAVSLAPVVVLVDIFKGRKFDKNVIIEKIPFFILAFFFGVLAVKMQGNSVQPDIPYTISERFRIVNYTVIAYLQKLVVPTNLVGFYPYPAKPENNEIASYFWFFPLAVFAIIAGTIYSLKYTKVIFFSIGFFFVTIFLVLQILPVGGAIMADRYAYVPSIGFFMLAMYAVKMIVDYLNKNMKAVTNVFYVLLAVYVLWLPVKTYGYCKNWDGSIKFYASVLQEFPTCMIMRYNRGNEFFKAEKLEEALVDFKANMEIIPDDFKPIQMVGAIYVKQKKFREAINLFNKVFTMVDTNFDASNNRASAYGMLNINDSALIDFNKAVELRPYDVNARANRDLLVKNMKGGEENSIEGIAKKIKESPEKPELYTLLGRKYLETKEYNKAMENFDIAIKMDAKQEDAQYYKGTIYDSQNDLDNAILQYSKVLKLNAKNESALNSRGIANGKKGNLDLAIKDFEILKTVNPNNKDAFYNLGFCYHILKQDDKACPFIHRAAELGDEQAIKAMNDFCKGK